MAFSDDTKKCTGIFGGGLFTFLLAAAMVVVGAMHLDFDAKDPVASGECAANTQIPVFLIAGGILLVLIMILRFIFMVRDRRLVCIRIASSRFRK